MLRNDEPNLTEKININLLNTCIERNRKNMKKGINYSFLEKISSMMLKKLEWGKVLEPLVLYDKEKAISVVLNFFDSLGNKEWYDKALSILMGQNKNIGINIFELDDIEDINEIDENGLHIYSFNSQMEHRKNSKALVKVVLKEEFRDIHGVMPKDKITLNDIYTIVHEISHTFDLGEHNKNMMQRNLFGEIVPHCFERMLGRYLVENNLSSESVVNRLQESRTEQSLRHARAVCAKMKLIELQEKEGTLTKNNVKETLEKNNIQNPFYVKEMLEDVIESRPSVDFDARYAIADITSYSYMELYNKDKRDSIKRLGQYCEEIKKGNTDEDILKLVGCPTNEKEVEKVLNSIRDDRNR